MPCDYFSLPHPGIQNLSPYIPGKSVEKVVLEYGIAEVIKMASNENAFGCSPWVMETLQSMTIEQVMTYPQASEDPLKEQLSLHLNLEKERITISNGSDAIIPLLLTLFALHREKKMLTHDVAFITYAICANTLGIPIIKTPLTPDWRVDIDAMIKACDDQVAVIFFANPNNPTGLPIAQSDIQKLLEHIPETTILVVDEAYYEYSTDPLKNNTQNLLQTHENLVILRTFSKAYGLAGLRLGYAISSPKITSLLHRVMLPFTVNKPALLAGSVALKDRKFIQQTLQNTQKGLKQMELGLSRMNIPYLPSSCNFITIDCQQATIPLFQKLQQQGIIVRPLQPYGLNHHLRVTIGTKLQNHRFLEIFEEISHDK